MDIAEFAAYVVAVAVGLDMIAERWLTCCKYKRRDIPPPVSPTEFEVENGTALNREDSLGSFSDFGEN